MNRVAAQIGRLARKIDREIHLMEVCGTHTVSIFKHGIRSLLTSTIKLLSGPGCPVCVTAVTDVDTAIELSKQGDVILATFGDMMRVPGSTQSLYDARAGGADIRIVYSPLDCISLARDNGKKRIVFFGTGFETTSPSVAAMVHLADNEKIENLYLYSVHKLVPPALKLLTNVKELNIDGFILPGHVSTMIGVKPYRFLSEEYKIASVIAGFGPDDILQSILLLLRQVDSGNPIVETQYKGVVKEEGNPKAMGFLDKYFQAEDVEWRGIGIIEKSGLVLREEFSERNALAVFNIKPERKADTRGCRCGEVLTGKITPRECPLFGRACTPEKPVGACMVSTEGSCAAYYKYGEHSWS